LTTEPDEKDNTAPIELAHPPATAAPASPREILETPTDSDGATEAAALPGLTPRPASAAQQEVMFVPLAVSIGDGFKFGCGFFLAMVLALLVAFVLLAVLFVLTSLFGLNLPISR